MTERQTNDPLSYLGVRAPEPSNLIKASRAPLTSDTTSPTGTILLGDFWLDEAAGDLYCLVGVAAGTATWKICT